MLPFMHTHVFVNRHASTSAHLQAAAHAALQSSQELRVQRSSWGVGHDVPQL